MLEPGFLTAFLQVVMIDLVLAGDNAIVIGMAAAGLPADLRKKAILIGIGAATLMRVCFALIAAKLLAITGLMLAGGLLLLWVCWKMYEELRFSRHEEAEAVEALEGVESDPNGPPRKTLRQAVTQIIIADVSMSLDNVLGVAGAARDHPIVLVAGLALSIALMGLASSFIAGLLNRHRWIAWVGLLVILYVAGNMIWHGWQDVAARGVPVLGIEAPFPAEVAPGAPAPGH